VCPFTEDEKNKIIRLYTVEHRGKSYIGSLFGRSDYCISYWLKKWGVPSLSRSEVSKKIREVYGPIQGFVGRTHSESSKQKITKSLRKAWRRGRTVGYAKCRTYSTVVGNVLGQFEVAYLQQLKEQQIELPTICATRFHTPCGTYMPDFEYQDRFVEVKSEFTLRVAQGRQAQIDGTMSNRQWKKINYVNKKIKPVSVVVIDKREAEKLFNRASQSGGILLCDMSV